ncbi:MAG: ATP-binding protein [Bacteroidota bacterium]
MDGNAFTRALADELIAGNAATLRTEFAWLSMVIEARIAGYLGFEGDFLAPHAISAPALPEGDSVYADVVEHFRLGREERLLLILALASQVAPQLLDAFFIKNKDLNRYFTEFGGQVPSSTGGFLPTLETAFFLMAGDDLESRLYLQAHFDPGHRLFAANVIEVEGAPQLAFTARRIAISEEYLALLTEGRVFRPEFSARFPAKRIATGLEWKELVLRPETREQIEELRGWLQYGREMMEDWGLGRKLSQGFRCLFHGPPGTGKTLTAALLGKVTGRDVYRVDLSMVVSKYIGETEKNLAGIFDQAEHKDWILFFDEADALFGKRTSTNNAHDRHANQEVSYLLQRVEDHDGLVILATNFKHNLDKAFHRRFQAMVEFAMPGPRARKQLWQNGFPEDVVLEEHINLDRIGAQFELAGGAIMNVVRFVCLKARMRGGSVIREADLLHGIRREVRKEGKTV